MDRRDGGVCLIEITLRELQQLFSTLDSPAEESIVSAVREIGSSPSRLVLQLPSGTTDDEACETVIAIRHYFAGRSRHAREQLRLLLVRGVISLLIGLAFLAICLSVRKLLLTNVQPGDAILSEGLLIVGWVAMWKPVEIFLYEWWPDLDRRRLFERIARIQIETLHA